MKTSILLSALLSFLIVASSSARAECPSRAPLCHAMHELDSAMQIIEDPSMGEFFGTDPAKAVQRIIATADEIAVAPASYAPAGAPPEAFGAMFNELSIKAKTLALAIALPDSD